MEKWDYVRNFSILWKTVSGEYRHPVPVSPDTVIQYRHLVPDRYWKHPVQHPVPPLIRYPSSSSREISISVIHIGIGYWIPVIGYRYRQIPVPDDSRRTLLLKELQLFSVSILLLLFFHSSTHLPLLHRSRSLALRHLEREK